MLRAVCLQVQFRADSAEQRSRPGLLAVADFEWTGQRHYRNMGCGRCKFPQYEEVFMSQPEKKDTQESARSTDANNKKSRGFTGEERAAMKQRAKELKAEERA